MGFRKSSIVSRKGISPIISTVFICAITIAAIAVMYPIVASKMSTPVYSIAITKANMIKQGSVLIVTVNIKNTGSQIANVNCIVYDASFNNYTCQEGTISVHPGVSDTFTIQSETYGSNFVVGQEYRIDVNDVNYGRLGEVYVFCTGR